jgi:hypothetical protein
MKPRKLANQSKKDSDLHSNCISHRLHSNRDQPDSRNDPENAKTSA